MHLATLGIRALKHLQTDGLWRTISLALATARSAIFYRPDDFDRRHGTDTAKPERLWRLRINSENLRHGRSFQTSSADFIHDAIEVPPIRRQDFTFLDLGCGKGRPVLIAAHMGFKSVIGVDFSAQLVAIAKENLRRCDLTDVQVTCADATSFNLPVGPLLVYLYNPFDAPVMLKVAERLLGHPDLVYIVYANPTCADVFDGAGFHRIATREHLKVWSNRTEGSSQSQSTFEL